MEHPSHPSFFRGFSTQDLRRSVDASRKHLPHWEREGATYFVTFRLADSIPSHLVARWREERDLWLAAHPPPWDSEAFRRYEDLFTQRINQWLDQGKGSCLLKDANLADLVERCLQKFDGERYFLGHYVVMPNHIHLLVRPLPEVELSSLTKAWKGVSAREINRRLGRNGSLWMSESFDRIVRDRWELEQYHRYIGDNPAKAKLATAYRLGHGKADWGFTA